MLAWLLRQPKIVERIIEVPVFLPSNGTKTRLQLWNDREYLRQLRDLAANRCFTTEGLQALEQIRAIADESKTPEELAGCVKCIKIIKNMLFAPAKAQKRLTAIDNSEDLQGAEI